MYKALWDTPLVFTPLPPQERLHPERT